MPKELTVDPARTRQTGRLEFPEIPLHAYDRPLAEERAARGDGDLVAMLRHMMTVRSFETMLGTLKARGEYGGVQLRYRGPAHLSIGQEAVSVGTAWALAPEDHVFGSHRSHGEFIAKALRAIDVMDEPALDVALCRPRNANLRRAAERHLPANDASRAAENFVLLGLLAEILMRSTGVNGGMGGSMHAFFTPLGVYPNNAIVAGSAAIATGAALHKLQHGSGIAVANIGDGASGSGVTWEAMNFAAMAQFDGLWSARAFPPVLFLFANNFYAMGGQTRGETMAWDRLSRVGAGLRADGLHGETVDGTRVLAVADAVARKREVLVRGEGPAVLDVECYRSTGHSTSDANAYRSREELEAWSPYDPIGLFAAELVTAGITDTASVEAMSADTEAQMARILAVAADPEATPPVDPGPTRALIGGYVFSDTRSDTSSHTDLAALADKSPRIRQLMRRPRYGRGEEGEVLGPMRTYTLRDGLFEAIAQRMLDDPSLIAYGEECREWGGAFGVYRGLSDLLPRERLFNAPISEAAIVATAVGYAIEGGRALVELMYGDFIGRAGDEILNQMAKWQAMSAGELDIPVVLRCSLGSKYGAQHSQDWSALVAHVPGLKVIYPATPYDARGLMASALAGNDPVVVFESQRLYDVGELFRTEGVPQEHYALPIGRSDVKRAGTDLTVLTIGPSLYAAIAAADEMQQTHGASLEVIDARSLVPFDYAPVVDSVRRTGRLLIVSEASERGSFAMTLATNTARFAGDALRLPPRVLGAPNWIVPGAEMEDTYFPQAADVVAAAAELLDLAPPPVHATEEEAMRRAAAGL